ncbi:MAG: AAA family ATPase [Methylomonas sp.]|nr:AAA family ATPase [Methylomonas sp.]
MRVDSFRVTNFRSFPDSGLLELAPVNVLIGANNAGKSSLLRALHIIQQGGTYTGPDVRVGCRSSLIEINLSGVTNVPIWRAGDTPVTVKHEITLSSPNKKGVSIGWNQIMNGAGSSGGTYQLSNIEPNHFVVPYFSRRKTAAYSEDVREQAAMKMSIDMSNLAAKLSRIGNPYFPKHRQYAAACEDILGFVVSA